MKTTFRVISHLLKAYAVGVLLRAFIIQMKQEARDIVGQGGN